MLNTALSIQSRPLSVIIIHVQIYLCCINGTTNNDFNHKKWDYMIYICDWILENRLKYVLHFIGLASSHTHTLPVHCCINRLS